MEHATSSKKQRINAIKIYEDKQGDISG